MIYTITFNPALDYITQVENFEIGKINRTATEKILAGGKGLNVSIVLKNLEIENTAISFIAGFTGKELEKKIKEHQINTDFIEVKKGITRINVKIISTNNSNQSPKIETAINGNGPEITKEEMDLFFEKIKKIKPTDLVILSGNVPKCINEKIYEIICKELKQNEVPFIVDATQKLLVNTLQYKPILIKPNKQELEETFDVKIEKKEDIIFYAKKLQEKGAKNVLISLGGDGAILLTQNQEIYYSNAPKGKVISTVGSGDSMIAGFIAGLYKQNNYLEALKYGIASGSATAFGEELATKKDIEKLLEQVKIQKI